MSSKQEHAAKKAYMVERRKRVREEKKVKTDIYDIENLIYKYLFPSSKGWRATKDY